MILRSGTPPRIRRNTRQQTQNQRRETDEPVHKPRPIIRQDIRNQRAGTDTPVYKDDSYAFTETSFKMKINDPNQKKKREKLYSAQNYM